MNLAQALQEGLAVSFFSVTTQESLRLQHITLAQANGCVVHEFTETFACECALNVLAVGPRRDSGRIAKAMKELKGKP